MGGGLCGTCRKPPPGGSPAAGVRALAKRCFASKAPSPMGLCRRIRAPNVPAKAHPAHLVGFLRMRTGRTQSSAKQKQERQPSAAFPVSRASTHGVDALGLPLPDFQPRGSWKGWVGRAARYRWRHGWRHRAPWKGSRRVPDSLIRRVLQYTDIPTGNALNLTAPRKYPPRPCRCRCTWSPCRISAGDDAGRAAGLRYGSLRSHPAGGPGRSRRPAG